MTTVAAHPFIAQLPGPVGDRLSGCGTETRVPAGQYLLRAGQPADGFHLVVAGRVALEVAPPAGPPLVVETVDAGSAVGWSWLVQPHRWQFDARAVTDVVTLHVDARCVRAAMDEDPELAAALVERFCALIADRLRHARIQLLDLYGYVDRA